MTTITVPDWFLYMVTVALLASVIADGLKIYASYLERKIRMRK